MAESIIYSFELVDSQEKPVGEKIHSARQPESKHWTPLFALLKKLRKAQPFLSHLSCYTSRLSLSVYTYMNLSYLSVGDSWCTDESQPFKVNIEGTWHFDLQIFCLIMPSTLMENCPAKAVKI